MNLITLLGITYSLLLATGCSTRKTMNGIMSSWVDADIHEVVSQWGEPDEVRASKENKIYVWNHLTAGAAPKIVVRTSSTSSHTGSIGTTTAGGDAKYKNCQRLLGVTAQGKVVHWQWRGDSCPYSEKGPYANWRRKGSGS